MQGISHVSGSGLSEIIEGMTCYHLKAREFYTIIIKSMCDSIDHTGASFTGS